MCPGLEAMPGKELARTSSRNATVLLTQDHDIPHVGEGRWSWPPEAVPSSWDPLLEWGMVVSGDRNVANSPRSPPSATGHDLTRPRGGPSRMRIRLTACAMLPGRRSMESVPDGGSNDG